METPLVSVVMITYGHEKYISEAIKGVFIQKTNFPIELIIANDCSPDETDAIVKQLISKAPDNIEVKYTRHSQNIGMMKNHHWALKQAKGKYIAICDGDDYWINPQKLQYQVDFLEENPDYAICCHNFKILNNNILSEESFFDTIEVKETSDIIDLSKNNIIPTLSVCFRNTNIQFPTWTENAPLGDLILFLNVAQYGKIKYINEKWAIYRQNVGVWHRNKINYTKMIELYHNLASDFNHLSIVKNNLIVQKKKYIKALLKDLSFSEIFKNVYFKELSFFEKIKLLLRKFQ